ncbi:hypothetical protein ACFL54_00225 [Planctomycetota bacterium]
MHGECFRCHRTENEDYPKAPKFKCEECHSEQSDEVYVFADGRTLYLEVSTEGLEDGVPKVKSVLTGEFKECNFKLLDKENAAKADFKVVCKIQIEEVYDKLIPANSGVRLFRGSCQLEVYHGAKLILSKSIPSKVISDKIPLAAHKKIAGYLQTQAYWKISKAIWDVFLE